MVTNEVITVLNLVGATGAWSVSGTYDTSGADSVTLVVQAQGINYGSVAASDVDRGTGISSGQNATATYPAPLGTSYAPVLNGAKMSGSGTAAGPYTLIVLLVITRNS